MHYVTAGQGNPPIAFVHGFACTHIDWQPQIDFFKATNAVVACDLRGHGDTPGGSNDCSIESYGTDVAAIKAAKPVRAMVRNISRGFKGRIGLAT